MESKEAKEIIKKDPKVRGLSKQSDFFCFSKNLLHVSITSPHNAWASGIYRD